VWLYVLRRLGFLLLTLLVTSVVIFVVTRWLPGDVARVILGREAGEAAVQAVREELGLDEPLHVQYVDWITGFATGDWGRSYSTGDEIRPLVANRVRSSLMLAAVTLLLAVPLAVGLGVLSGLNEGTWVDSFISIATLSVVGLPEFVTGIILIQVFAFGLGLFPATSLISPGAGFFEALPSLILPAMTAMLVLLAYIARLVRSGVIEELKQPYVRTATLKGLPYRTVVVRHVLRNALLPAVTVLAISIGWLVSGLIIVENVYNYPGLGRLFVFAVDRRDLPLIQAITMVTVVAFASANLLADIAYAFLNPRIRLGE
jgi:peptide/nickel transport system permease protein